VTYDDILYVRVVKVFIYVQLDIPKRRGTGTHNNDKLDFIQKCKKKLCNLMESFYYVLCTLLSTGMHRIRLHNWS